MPTPMPRAYYEKYKIEIETVTPIHISNGKEYSIFLINGNKKLREDSVINKALEEMNIEELKRTDIKTIFEKYNNINDEDAVEYFIEDVDLNAFVSKKIKTVSEFIKTVVEDKKLPFIPGSTIKGVILTALINKYYNNKEKGGKRKISNKLLISSTYSKFLESNANGIEKLDKLKKNKKKMMYTYFNPLILVEDAIFNENVSVDFVNVGSVEIPVEIIPSGRKTTTHISLRNVSNGFDIKLTIDEIFESLREFGKKYLEKIKNISEKKHMKSLSNYISSLIEENMKDKNSVIIPLGRFAGRYSKTIPKTYSKKDRGRIKTVRNKPIGLCKLTIKDKNS